MVASCLWPLVSAAGCSGREEVRGPRVSSSTASSKAGSATNRITSSESRHRRPHLPREEPQIRVRVANRSEQTIELGGVGQRLWLTIPDADAEGRLVVGPVRCRFRNGRWSIRSNRNGRTLAFTTPPTDRIRVVTAGTADTRVAYRSIALPGVVNLIARTNGGIDVICHLDMEDYLPGVLAGELYESWLPQTHAAVAVAARSFAVCERHYWLSRRDFDVVAGEKSQMWVGATDSSRPLDAVRRTRGEVLVFENAVVPGYYSAACGGRPARATDAISPNPVNAITPLEGDAVPLERCGCRTFGSHGSWRTTLRGEAVAEALRAWGRRRGVGSIARATWPLDIDVVDRRVSGRPTRFEIRPASGSKATEIGASDLQRSLNAVGSGRPVRSSDFEVTRRGRDLVVVGAGFGHGVGLCQYGAESMARDGASHRAILRRYYPEAEVRSAWG